MIYSLISEGHLVLFFYIIFSLTSVIEYAAKGLHNKAYTL